MRPTLPLPSSRCSCVCGSPRSEVGNELTHAKTCGTDWICRKSSVNPERTCRKRAPKGWSESFRYSASVLKPLTTWPSCKSSSDSAPDFWPVAAGMELIVIATPISTAHERDNRLLFIEHSQGKELLLVYCKTPRKCTYAWQGPD